MTTSIKIGIRDLVRNTNILEKYDYIEIEDKKTRKSKGLFISDKYADEIKKFLDEKISKEKQEKLNRLMKFAGKGEIYERFNTLTSREIRENVAKEKYGD